MSSANKSPTSFSTGSKPSLAGYFWMYIQSHKLKPLQPSMRDGKRCKKLERHIAGICVKTLPVNFINANSEVFKFILAPCPGGPCWGRDYISGECVPKAACSKVTCGSGVMSIAFSSTLFGIFRPASPFEFAPVDATTRPIPKWNAPSKLWSTQCNLGECGMDTQIENG